MLYKLILDLKYLHGQSDYHNKKPIGFCVYLPKTMYYQLTRISIADIVRECHKTSLLNVHDTSHGHRFIEKSDKN